MDGILAADPTFCDRNAAGTAFIVISSICFVAASILLALRLYVRLVLVKSFWWDDATLIASYILYVPTTGLLWRTAALGLGRDKACLPLEAALEIGKLETVGEVVQTFCVIFARTSAALFVLRLFGVSRWLKISLRAYTVFMILALAITAILVFFQCSPAEALWDPLVPAHCWPAEGRAALHEFNGAVSILSDVVLALLPAYFLWKLQMALTLKLTVGSLFALGLVPAACAAARAALSHIQNSPDPIRDDAILILFGSLETSMLIICATLTALRALFTRDKPRRNTYQRQNDQRQGDANGVEGYQIHNRDVGTRRSRTKSVGIIPANDLDAQLLISTSTRDGSSTKSDVADLVPGEP